MLPQGLAERIAEKSDRNLRRALLMCEACKVEQYPFVENQNITEPDWLLFLRMVARKASEDQSIQRLAMIRGHLYELLIHGIPSNIIFKTLVDELVKNCDMQLKTKVIEQAAFYEQRLQLGNKEIYHLEAFMAKFMCLYKKFMEEALGDAF